MRDTRNRQFSVAYCQRKILQQKAAHSKANPTLYSQRHIDPTNPHDQPPQADNRVKNKNRPVNRDGKPGSEPLTTAHGSLPGLTTRKTTYSPANTTPNPNTNQKHNTPTAGE